MNTCFTFKPEYSCRTTGSYKDRHKLKCSIKAYINAQRCPPDEAGFGMQALISVI